MAKLFLQQLPSFEDFQQNINKADLGDSVDALYTSVLISKVGNELENTLDSVLSAYSLSSGRFLMLSLLLRKGNESGVKPTDLSQQLGVTQATMSGLISNLEKSGYIEKTVNGQDARSYSIKASPKGLNVYSEVLPLWAKSMKNYFDIFNPQEFSNLIQLLEKLKTSKVPV